MAISIIRNTRIVRTIDIPSNGSVNIELKRENTYLLYGVSNVHKGLVCMQTHNTEVYAIHTFIEPYNITYTTSGLIVTATNSSRYNLKIYLLTLPT